jgi:Fe-S-cluster containining protein
MKRVEALPVVIRGKNGYEIKVNSFDATVQDYLDAINVFIEKNVLFRSRNSAAGSCYGCDLCCQERIPMTVVDVLKLQGTNLEEVFQKFLHVYVEDRIVDITMALDNSRRCIFLDKGKAICTIYEKRPLVCQTFVCCPASETAQLLREKIVNTGEDELVRLWFSVTDNHELIINEAISPNLNIKDYPKTPFFDAEQYKQVKLRDICSLALWSKLIDNME